jgi:hypothetical protein
MGYRGEGKPFLGLPFQTMSTPTLEVDTDAELSSGDYRFPFSPKAKEGETMSVRSMGRLHI